MVSEDMLKEISRRITAQLHPDKIILFGSYAWGNPSDDSDLDLLVVVPDSAESAHARAARVHRALRGIPVPCDVMVRTRAEISRVNPARSSLLYRALHEGRVLHA
ncbi:nucleotidyltransferase domain-containing protein [Aromatoleum anaerobium]|uniref:Nucleotidyltransferase domain-containing protein n=1 Tax=Aromatoleum anaerobium TaxID=182180 RepID=A0ABX1PFL2_9RHOO|nr:nucleotidyltransferase domain-containing protein [Aromatoleum anaerobium]MCK0509194.1 nucleotidyltransferase domain-containing protein [Aromatoleum anaerobium]